MLALVMAGGKGHRLHPLTEHRTKPAVPFGGKFRIIDFVLSNMVNSGIHSVYVLTQFKSQSLLEHLSLVWSMPNIRNDYFIAPLPAQMRRGNDWYRGTADSIYQNFDRLEEHRPDIVAVFAGDHIYRMDVAQMVQYHREKEAEATVSVIRAPIAEASRFGVVEVDQNWEVVGFEEKPENPKSIPGQENVALVSMGNYLFEREVLMREVSEDAPRKSSHDFGKDIIPSMLGRTKLLAYDFTRNRVPGSPPEQPNTYWRDIGTLDAYYEANMDLKSVVPQLNLYQPEWPIRSELTTNAPVKFVHSSQGRLGHAVNSMVCDGSIISGGSVNDSIIGPRVCVESYADVTESILLEGVRVGEGARIRRAIIDKYVDVAPGAQIGIDLEKDREKYTVSDSGILVIPKGAKTRESTELTL